MNRKAESKTDRMATFVCLCSLCTCLVAHAEDKSAEIGGVLYHYRTDGCEANGNKQVFLGCCGECAVEIPDDRTRLAIPKVINGMVRYRLNSIFPWQMSFFVTGRLCRIQ